MNVKFCVLCKFYARIPAATFSLLTAVHGGNGDSRTCRDIAHRWDGSIVAVILIDVLNDRRFCFISDVFHDASNAETNCFNNILTQVQGFVNIFETICFRCFLCFLRGRYWAVNSRHTAAHAADAGGYFVRWELVRLKRRCARVPFGAVTGDLVN